MDGDPNRVVISGEDGGHVDFERSCLICSGGSDSSLPSSSKTSSTTSPSPHTSHWQGGGKCSVALSQDLGVYFVLRHVLGLSTEHLEKFLRKCPNPPRDWVGFCEPCRANYVDKCKRLFGELMEVKRRFEGARLELIGAIKKTLSFAGNVHKPGLEAKKKLQNHFLDVRKETREFVEKHDYQHLLIGSSSETSNILAEEKLTAKKPGFNLKENEDQFSENNRTVDKGRNANVRVPEIITASERHHELLQTSNEVHVKSEATSPEPREDEDAGGGDKLSPDDFHGFNDDSKEYEDEGNHDRVSIASDGGNESSQSSDGEWENESDDNSSDSSSSEREVKMSTILLSKDEDKEAMRLRIIEKIKNNAEKYRQWSLQALKFHCDLCKEAFKLEHTLRAHQISVHKINYYQCSKCDWKGTKNYRLIGHVKRFHSEEKDLGELTCPNCLTGFDAPKRLKDHMTICNMDKEKRNMLACEQCDKEFRDKDKLSHHMGVIHGRKDLLPFACSFEGCGKAFRIKSNLIRHQDRHKPTKHECQQCGKKYKHLQKLKAHVDCGNCHVKKQFTCELCPSSFCKNYSLKNHLIKNHSLTTGDLKKYGFQEKIINVNSIHCDMCPATFKKESQYRGHFARFHKVKPTQYECDLCGEILKSSDSLSRHKKHHKLNGEKPFPCDICNFRFSRRDNMLLHKKRCHKLDSAPATPASAGTKVLKKYKAKARVLRVRNCFKCSECGLSFAFRNKLRRHIERIHGGNGTINEDIQCAQCSAAFKTRSDLRRHHSQVHKVTAIYKCNNCEFNTENRTKYYAHLKKDHGIGVKEQVNSRKKIAKKQKCPICEQVMCSKFSLQLHMARRHNSGQQDREKISCEHCGRGYFEKVNLLNHLALVHDVKDYQRHTCSFEGCGKSFYLNSQLKYHEEMQHRKGQGQLICETCGKVCAGPRSLKKHVRTDHGSASAEIKCNLCPALFQLKNSYYYHLKNVHSSSKDDTKKKKLRNPAQFKCSECGGGFYLKKHLKRHMERIHGIKASEELDVFRCPICEKILSSKWTLEKHVVETHEKKNQVCCELCGKVLGSHYYMKLHKRRKHNIGDFELPKFPCSVEGCSKVFESKNLWKTHVEFVHEGKRNFQCDHCGKHIISSTNLRRHIEVMHSENREAKPFKCDECGKGFAISEYLYLHKKTHQSK